MCSHMCVCVPACAQIYKCTYDMQANRKLLEGSFRNWWIVIWVLLWSEHCYVCVPPPLRWECLLCTVVY